jgi:hypothetical protein
VSKKYWLGFGSRAKKKHDAPHGCPALEQRWRSQRIGAAPSLPDLLRWTMARCVKTPTKGSSSRQLSPLKAAQDHVIKQPPRRRLGGAGCFRRCAPARTEGLHDDLDGTPLRAPSPPKSIPSSDPPRLADAIAAYNKLMDAEESLVEVVGLDGLRRHRRRRDVVDEDRACDKPCWGLDDDLDDYPPACGAECPIS